MKTKILITLALFNAQFANSQITINASDMPLMPTYNMTNLNVSTIANPTSGNNQHWNYAGSAFIGNPFQNNYPPETDTFFTNLGCETFISFTKPFGNSALTYDYFENWDFNNNGIFVKGYYVGPSSTFALDLIGGASTDSIGSDELKIVSNNPVALFKFPMTIGSTWSTVSTNQFDNWITWTALGLNHAPLVHQFTTYRTDSVLAWGKLTVYTPNGPSIPYDVLMRKTMGYQQDSLFVNGSPDSIIINDFFSFEQGTRNSYINQIDFFRAGSFRYLMRLNYGNDTTFTTPIQVFQNTDNLTAVPTSLQNKNESSFSVFIYPNPSNTGQLNLQVFGKNISNSKIVITDVFGKMVQQGNADFNSGNNATINFASHLMNGNYILTIVDESNKKILSEKIVLNR